LSLFLAFKMASWSGTVPLEHSSSAMWKHFGFPSKDGRIVESDKRNDGEFIVRFLDVTIHILAIQVTCGSI